MEEGGREGGRAGGREQRVKRKRVRRVGCDVGWRLLTVLRGARAHVFLVVEDEGILELHLQHLLPQKHTRTHARTHARIPEMA